MSDIGHEHHRPEPNSAPSPCSRRHPKPVIGLTGGIGAGKSTVAGMLRNLGAAVIDSDRLIHDELRCTDVVETLARWWGKRVLLVDGSVDRRAVAEIVFRDPTELTRLQDLLYPRIDRRRREMMPGLFADDEVRAIVLEVPRLYEVGLERECDAVIFLEADRTDREVRLAQSRGWSAEELDRREKQLFPLDRKRPLADYVVENHSTQDALRRKVESVFSSILTDFTTTQ